VLLPEKLLSRLKTIHPKEYEKILDGFSQKRIGSFRINFLKSSVEEVLQECKKKNIQVFPFKHIPEVFTFERKDEYAIKGTQNFYEGKIYLQSIASMLPVLALSPQKNTKILDVCAAPGSKTTQIAALTENSSEIIALEKNHIRCEKLRYNCNLQGANSVEVKKIDALKYLADAKTPLFDQILLDAPCSAEGRIFLENEKSYGFWSQENILEKAQLQYEIFSLALTKLKKGGELVYSTCTLAPEENEGVVTKILEENSDIILEKISFWDEQYFLPGISEFNREKFLEPEKMMRVLPSKFTEGFFVVKIRKK
jgi:NOL1/NOP2/sun family putative RNA methylase